MRAFRVWLIACLSISPAFAETIPFDGTQPSATPRFSVGLRVEWSDGSRGRIVAPAEWREHDARGQWFYTVQFGGGDSLRWLLPESGLELLDD